MKYTIEKEVSWDMGHRLLNHKGKCHNVHGHTYRAIITMGSDKLDHNGFVLDFYHFKPLRKWIDENLDHAFLYNSHDTALAATLGSMSSKRYELDNKDPSAENIAELIYFKAIKFLLDRDKHEPVGEGEVIRDLSDVKVLSVTVFETPTSSAVYRP